MARANKGYEIRSMVCDWALDIPMGDTTFVLYFNSQNNAELVKAVLEWEDAHPNEAIPYQPTLTPPNEPLPLEQLREMDGEPVWVTPLGFWALVIAKPGKRVQLISNDGETVWADKEIELVGPIYRRPPEGEA